MQNRPRTNIILTLILLLSLVAGSGMGQESDEEKLIIGTKVTPPFVMEAPDGALRGISIDLWEIVAEELRTQSRVLQ